MARYYEDSDWLYVDTVTDGLKRIQGTDLYHRKLEKSEYMTMALVVEKDQTLYKLPLSDYYYREDEWFALGSVYALAQKWNSDKMGPVLLRKAKTNYGGLSVQFPPEDAPGMKIGEAYPVSIAITSSPQGWTDDDMTYVWTDNKSGRLTYCDPNQGAVSEATCTGMPADGMPMTLTEVRATYPDGHVSTLVQPSPIYAGAPSDPSFLMVWYYDSKVDLENMNYDDVYSHPDVNPGQNCRVFYLSVDRGETPISSADGYQFQFNWPGEGQTQPPPEWGIENLYMRTTRNGQWYNTNNETIYIARPGIYQFEIRVRNEQLWGLGEELSYSWEVTYYENDRKDQSGGPQVPPDPWPDPGPPG